MCTEQTDIREGWTLCFERISTDARVLVSPGMHVPGISAAEGLLMQVDEGIGRLHLRQVLAPFDATGLASFEFKLIWRQSGSAVLQDVVLLRDLLDADPIIKRTAEGTGDEWQVLTIRSALPPDLAGKGCVWQMNFAGAGNIQIAQCECIGMNTVDLPNDGNGSAGKHKVTVRPKVVVVSWDLAHNPAGRAFLLADMVSRGYDVELVGPLSPVFGDVLWEPIANSPLPITTFNAGSLREIALGARKLTAKLQCDFVYVSKPRLPSLLIGALIKQLNGCPMVVDIDDHELSFFSESALVSLDELRQAGPEERKQLLERPHASLWTRYAESLIKHADAITVSNVPLRRRFGGLIVRHARDEKIFDATRYNRRQIRAEFGYGDEDRVVLFLGTPRPHKGIFSLIECLELIGDPRLSLCVIGSPRDKATALRLASINNPRISLYPDQPWDRLAELVSMADAVYLLQDPGSQIAHYQIPAKLTDALALGVRVYATETAPIADFIAADAVTLVPDAASLEASLRALAIASSSGDHGRSGHDYYLSELSYSVNSARIDAAFNAAALRSTSRAPAFDDMFDFVEACTGVRLPRFDVAASPARRSRYVARGEPIDLVIAWKQNDSDLYGRRSDMVLRYLMRSGIVRKVLHLDAPIDLTSLQALAQTDRRVNAHEADFIYLNTLKRVLGQADEENITRRTFVYRSGNEPAQLLGRPVARQWRYGAYIRESMKEAGIGPSPMLWVFPIHPRFADLVQAVNPGLIVADFVDDQRSFAKTAVSVSRMQAEYKQVFKEADVLFTNCRRVADFVAEARPDVHLVPNGAEGLDILREENVPYDIQKLPRPIIGYVGNMNDRLDLELLDKVSRRFPAASIVLIGSAHRNPAVTKMASRRNVHLVGVRPYQEARQYIKTFDVAIMPHVKNAVSDAMNPLKLYVYFSLGVPIVTTDVANIDDLASHVLVGESHDAFVDHVASVLDGTTAPIDEAVRESVLEHVSWDSRISQMLRYIGFDRPAKRTAPTPLAPFPPEANGETGAKAAVETVAPASLALEGSATQIDR